MTKPLLPPRGIFVGSPLLFTRDIAPPLRDTLIQLMALTWGSEAHLTPPLSLGVLEKLTGKKARTVRAHLAFLRSYRAALRLRPAGDGQFIIKVAGWVFGPQGDGQSGKQPPGSKNLPGQNGRILPQPDQNHKEEEEDSQFLNFKDFLPPPPLDDHDSDLWSENDLDEPEGNPDPPHRASFSRRMKRAGHRYLLIHRVPILQVPRESPPPQPHRSKKPARPDQTLEFPPDPIPGPPLALPPELLEQMREAGVFENLFPEVERISGEAGWSVGDLSALLDWCKEDRPDHPGGLFIGRMRKGFRAPKAFHQPACPYCHRRGKHERGCPRSYALEEPDG